MDIDNLSDVWQFIENYLVLIQENQYNTLIIKKLALSLLQPRVNISANYNILRGQSSNQSDVPSDQVNMIEIAFTKTSILELHLKREYMFDSTKGQSNYVFGTHYYFGEPPFSDFPSLNDFSID